MEQNPTHKRTATYSTSSEVRSWKIPAGKVVREMLVRDLFSRVSRVHDERSRDNTLATIMATDKN